MITIRSSNNISQPTLVGFKATLTTSVGVYEFESNGALFDPTPSGGRGLFGPISWPRFMFRLGQDTAIEQQMFLPHDCSDVAISWQLAGKIIPATLVVRPHFAGCGPRNYRDRGFQWDDQEHGGRLTWLPNVRGPKLIADTNGQYYDEPPTRIANGDCETAAGDGKVVPGVFEFHLSGHPSVLIFSTDGHARSSRDHEVGLFLAGLLDNSVHTPEAERSHSVIRAIDRGLSKANALH